MKVKAPFINTFATEFSLYIKPFKQFPSSVESAKFLKCEYGLWTICLLPDVVMYPDFHRHREM